MEYFVPISFFVLFLALCLAFAFFTGSQAKKKGYSYDGFSIFGFFFPLIALIVVMCLPDRSVPEGLADVELLRYRRGQEAKAAELAIEKAKRRKVNVARAGQELGAFSIREIVSMINAGNLDLDDYWLDPERNAWEPLRSLEGV